MGEWGTDWDGNAYNLQHAKSLVPSFEFSFFFFLVRQVAYLEKIPPRFGRKGSVDVPGSGVLGGVETTEKQQRSPWAELGEVG